MSNNSFIQAISHSGEQNIFYLSRGLSEWLFASDFWMSFNLENGTIFDQYEEDEVSPEIAKKLAVFMEDKINELAESIEDVVEFVYAKSLNGSSLLMRVKKNNLLNEMIELRNYLIEFSDKSSLFIFSL